MTTRPEPALFRVELDRGILKWKTSLRQFEPKGLVLADGCLLTHGIERERMSLLCHDFAGKRQWSFETREPVLGVAGLDGILLVATRSYIRALDLPSGKKLWAIELADRVTSGPVVNGPRYYLGQGRGISSRSMVDGRELWHTLTGMARTRLALAHGRIVYVNVEDELVFVRADEGRIERKIKDVDPRIPSVLAHNAVLYGTKEGLVRFDYDSLSSAVLLYGTALDELTSPVVLSNSHLLFGLKGRGLACAGPARE